MDPKDTPDPSKNGNPPANPPGNPDPNIVALQKKLSEKDVELKAAQEKIAAAEKAGQATDETTRALTAMSEEVKKLGGTIAQMESDKERERLRGAYPDIVPELLLGKTHEEIERLVVAQRETIEKNYVRQPSAHAPQFASRAAVEAEITRLETDNTIPIATKFAKLRELKIERDEF